MVEVGSGVEVANGKMIHKRNLEIRIPAAFLDLFRPCFAPFQNGKISH